MEPTIATDLVTHANSMDLMNLFWQAHWFVKFIMLLLLCMSVVTWTLWFAKGRQLKHAHKQAKTFEETFWNGDDFVTLFKDASPKSLEHPLAKIVAVGLKEWEQEEEHALSSRNTLSIDATTRARRLMDATMSREMDKLETGLPMLATIGSTAPFIGLLGTVWGIMGSFQNIATLKNTSLAVVAPGIAEALLATAIGLFAAIPAVIAYNRLATSVGKYAGRVEAFATEFLNILDKSDAFTSKKAKKSA